EREDAFRRVRVADVHPVAAVLEAALDRVIVAVVDHGVRDLPEIMQPDERVRERVDAAVSRHADGRRPHRQELRETALSVPPMPSSRPQSVRSVGHFSLSTWPYPMRISCTVSAL